MSVVMFHSVGCDKSPWIQNWLSIPLIQFDYFCAFLMKKKYNTLFLDEWYEKEDKGIMGPKDIVLTFDDGYLDSWTFVYPTLKKYGLKGTIYVNPEFVVDSSIRRPNILDTKREDLVFKDYVGFLNWEEIKYLDKTDEIDIQSHSMTHNYYFKSDKLIDIYSGNDDYHWLNWNHFPKKKATWMLDNPKDLIHPSFPIFEYDRALAIKQFIPSEDFLAYMKLEYEKDSNFDFHATAQVFKEKKGALGVYESNEACHERFMYDIVNSKNILEEQLNKEVKHFCWPGGGYNELSLSIAENAGYMTSTIASKERNAVFESNGEYKRIPRFGLGAVYKKNGSWKHIKSRYYITFSFLSKRKNFVAKNMCRVIKGFEKLFLN